MKTITCERSFQSALLASIIKEVFQLGNRVITVGSDIHTTEESLHASDYTFETMCHEFERRYGKLAWFNLPASAQKVIKHHIESLLASSNEEHHTIVFSFLRAMLQKNMGHIKHYFSEMKDAVTVMRAREFSPFTPFAMAT